MCGPHISLVQRKASRRIALVGRLGFSYHAVPFYPASAHIHPSHLCMAFSAVDHICLLPSLNKNIPPLRLQLCFPRFHALSTGPERFTTSSGWEFRSREPRRYPKRQLQSTIFPSASPAIKSHPSRPHQQTPSPPASPRALPQESHIESRITLVAGFQIASTV